MNIKDVARAAGVSTATVSRVTNGKPVKASTKEKILRIMHELDYIPNALARGLVVSATTTVGVLISDIADVFFAKQLSIIEIELRKKGYNIIVVCLDDGMSESTKRQQIQVLLGSHVAGIIFIGPKFQENIIQNYVHGDLPVIMLNDCSNTPGYYSVVADDFTAVSELVQRLYLKGRRNFVYLYDRISPSGNEKLKGFQYGLSQCGLSVDSDRIFLCPREITSSQKVVAELLASYMKIDVIITSQDELAIGAIKAALALNRKIPSQISIVGYNNSIFALGSTPELSSIDNNIQTLAEIAIKTFFSVLEGAAVPRKIMVSCNLIERETS